MLSKTRYLFVAFLAVWVYACDEESGSNVEPPPPPAQLNVTAYDPQSSGLSRDVWDVFVDSNDRLWLATNTGVWMKELPNGPVRTYDDFNGIRNRQIRGVQEVGDKIWVATWGGGVAFADAAAITDTTMWTSLWTEDGLVNDKVSDVESDGTSNVWFATAGGVSQYRDVASINPPNRWITRNGVLNPGSLVVRSLLRIIPTGDVRQIWMCKQGDGITIMNFANNPWLTPSNSAMPEDIVNQSIYDAANDLFWVVFPTAGLASVDMKGSKWTLYTTRNGLLSNLCHSVAVESDGTVWVGTQVGLSRLDTSGKFTNYIRGSGLPSERIRKVHVDSSDRVWLAFVEGGAAQVSPR